MKLKPVKAKCLLERTTFVLSPAHVFYQVILPLDLGFHRKKIVPKSVPKVTVSY